MDKEALTRLLAEHDAALLKHRVLERQLTAACAAYGRDNGLFGYSIRCLRRDIIWEKDTPA